MARRSRTRSSIAVDDHYFARSRQPLHALMFLLPLLITYEVGAFFYANEQIGRRLAARSWLQQFLDLFGDVGQYLPGLLVVVVLFVMHIVQKKRWRFRLGVYVGMMCESLLLAGPLLVFGLLTGPGALTALAAGGGADSWQAWMIFSIGAGIYEELVFRMILIALLHFIIVDAIGAPAPHGAVIAIVGSAVLFALSHFSAENPFTLAGFAFYALAGLYFAVIYLLRGFGIVVATHALYDVIVVSMQHELWPAMTKMAIHS